MAPRASSSTTTRWSPTAEQLMILEEMYRRGVKTPNASQIQRITAHLSAYGKIEGKNVFYWFQNHKARDRQKLRRKLMMHHQYHHHQYYNNHKNYYRLHSPSASLHHQLPQYVSPSFVNQDASREWKVDLHERCEMDKPINRTYGRDWMMMTTMMMDLINLRKSKRTSEDWARSWAFV
ncbi:hypothetical protein LguiB_000919 [Lonicera macranthoides]